MRPLLNYICILVSSLPCGLSFAGSPSTAIFFQPPPLVGDTPKPPVVVANAQPRATARPTSPVSDQNTGVKNNRGLMGPIELMTLAKESYPSIQVKRSDIQYSEYQRKAAKFQFLPSPTVTSEKRQGQNQVIVARLSQPLWTGGRLTAAYSGAELRLERSGVDLQSTELDVFFRISTLYQNFLSQYGRLLSQEKGLDRLKDLQEMMQRRVSQGVSSDSDLVLINSRITQAQADLVTLKAGLDVVISQLGQMVGMPLSAKDLISNDAMANENFGGSPITGTGLTLSQLVQNVSDIHPVSKRAMLDVEIAKQDVKLARSALSPEFSVRVEHQYGENPTSLKAGGRVYFDVRFAPNAGLGSFSALQAAASKVGSAEQQYEQSKRDVFDRVSFEWTDHQSSIQQVNALVTSRKDSEFIVNSSLRLFVTGRKTWLDLLNANRELTQIEQREADARALRVATALRLRILMGQFWDTDTSAVIAKSE